MPKSRTILAGGCGRRLGNILAALFVLFLLTSGMLLLLASRVRLPGEESTPSGMRRNTSLYVRMSDGTRIAVDVLLPSDYRAGERLPVLMRSTRYWRAIQPRIGFRMMVLLHIKPADELIRACDKYFSQRGYVLVLSDMRGTGASEGTLESQYSQDEISDLGNLAKWAAAQPWSNGRVGAFGTSYEGNTAELTAVKGIPSVRAAAVLFDDFDTMLGWVRPGGVYDRHTIDAWIKGLASFDSNDSCGVARVTGWRCLLHRLDYSGVKPTDEDRDGHQLRTVLAYRNNPDLMKTFVPVEFRDDLIATSKGPINQAQVTPYGLRGPIEASHVPMMVWCGWMDAGTSDGALNRYRNFSNPQILVLGAFTHGGSHGTDPLLANFDPPNPPSEEQLRMQADFFDEILRPPIPAKIDRHIDYYTLGEGAWHSTVNWPPAGMTTKRLYFAADHRLDRASPVGSNNNDSYMVDFSTTTGEHTRWLTQLDGGYVSYGDRAGEDARLLTYTSDLLSSDTEITGSPVLSLELATSASDGAVHAYLEDVAPDGRVTYLTEGVFRLINRNRNQAPLPYEPLGPRHSYLRTDAALMTPMRPERVEFELFATSALLRKGHRIRVALAGADWGNFELIPADIPPRWTMYRSRNYSSFIELPTKSH